MMRARIRSCLALAHLSVLAGCSTLAPDGGIDRVSELARERNVAAPIASIDADEATSDARIAALLAQPLTPEAAVEIAVNRNAGFRARIADLAAADAQRVQAGRLANPSFAFSDKRSPELRWIERTLMVNVLSIVTLPLNQKLATRRFEEAQLRLAGDAVALAAETRRAWVRAVAAGEQLAYFEQANEAASAASELASRMRAIGTFTELQRLRQQAFAAETAATLARARNNRKMERERLTRLLGLWGADADFELPARLPDLPRALDTPTDAERVALERRVDVLAATRGAEATAEAHELTRITRFINVLHAGYVNESERGERRADGYEVEVELPLFDFGDAKARRAERAYLAALERVREVAVTARSEVRERHAAYVTAYDLARHYREQLVPTRKAIAEEMLLRYNGMLIGVFELLADAREQVMSVNQAIEASRDFWIAESHFHQALVGGSAAGGTLSTPTASPAAEVGH
jgi:outer membrane protein TolC